MPRFSKRSVCRLYHKPCPGHGGEARRHERGSDDTPVYYDVPLNSRWRGARTAWQHPAIAGRSKRAPVGDGREPEQPAKSGGRRLKRRPPVAVWPTLAGGLVLRHGPPRSNEPAIAAGTHNGALVARPCASIVTCGPPGPSHRPAVPESAAGADRGGQQGPTNAGLYCLYLRYLIIGHSLGMCKLPPSLPGSAAAGAVLAMKMTVSELL